MTAVLTVRKIRSRIRIIGWTGATAGLPYIAALATSETVVNTLRANISSSFHATSTAAARDYLKLTDFVVPEESVYVVVVAMERRAIDLGYFELA